MARARRSSPGTRGVVLDAGAFIALEQRSGYATRLLRQLVHASVPLVTSGGVVAQIWRGGASRQAPVAMLLALVDVVGLDRQEGKVVGMVLGASGARDPVDAHLAVIARERAWPILSSDASDLRRIDPLLEIVEV